MQSEWAFCYTLVKREDMTVKTEKLENYFFHPVVRTKAHSSKTGRVGRWGERKENKPLANEQLVSL